MPVTKKQWSLLHVVENVPVNAKLKPLTTVLHAKGTEEVPDGTKFVHVSVTGMKLFFGDNEKKTVPRSLACIAFDIEKGAIWKSDEGKLQFTYEISAVLQDGLTSSPTGTWTGAFDLEIMCFG